MPQKLNEIIKKSAFEIKPGRYIYAKVANFPDPKKHFMIAKDAEEITVVTKEGNLRELNLMEKNKDFYTLIALNVSVPFYSVGFLAAVSGAIAKAKMDILIISTYSKDYILVREDYRGKTKKILRALGLTEKNKI